MHRVTVIPRAGRAPPADNDEAQSIIAGWRATHTLTARQLHALLIDAAARGITPAAALEELRRD